MPYKLKDPVRHKHDRGSLTIWFSEDAIEAWNASIPKVMKRGRQYRYSDLAIETCYTLHLVYKQPLRQTEGFIRSIAQLLHLDLLVPDHTTLSRRVRRIVVSKKVQQSKGKLVVIVDSTGL